MPRFSRFTPFPQLRFSSKPPIAKAMYDEINAAFGGEQNFSQEQESLVQATRYAQAMALGRLYNGLLRAESQFRPETALEQLPSMEREVGAMVSTEMSIAQRRRQVSALMRVSRGARRNNVESVLREALGDDFLYYQTEPPITSPLTPDPETTGVYVAPGTPIGVWRLRYVLMPGTNTVPFEQVAGDLELAVGDKVVLGLGDYERQEPAVIEAVFRPLSLVTITCAHPHPINMLIRTGRQPTQSNTTRHNLLVLSPEAAVDGEKRKLAQQLLHRLLRGVSTWSITDESGPFRVGVGRLGVTTIGEL